MSVTKALIAAWSTKAPMSNDSEIPLPEDRLTKFRNEVARILQRQGDEVAVQLGAQTLLSAAAAQTVADAVLSDPKWMTMFVNGVRPFVTDMLEEGGTAAMGKLPAETGGVFDVSNPKVQEFVDQYTVRLAANANEYTKVQLRDLIGDGLDKGETIGELTTRVRDWAAENDPIRGEPWRAERIARTESARAYTAGEEQAWRQSGVVQGKRWALAPEACEFCEAAAAEFESKTLALGQAFYTQGTAIKGKQGGVMVLDYGDVDGPPLHPNCRCALEPVMEAGDE